MKFLLGALALALIGLGWQSYRLDNLQEEAGTWRSSIEEARRLNEENKVKIAECKAAAEENIARATKRMLISREAARKAQLNNRELQERLNGLNDQATNLHGQLVGECPAVRDPKYIDFLCSGPLGCAGTGTD